MYIQEKKAFQDQWPNHATYCWGCGRNNEHGLQIKSYWDGDETICTWQPQRYHQTFSGILSSGIISTLIDCHSINSAYAMVYKKMGIKLNQKLKENYATASIKVDFLRPISTRKPVILKAKIKEMKKSKIIVNCLVYSKNKLCAIGEVIVVNLNRYSFKKELLLSLLHDKSI